MSKEKSKGDKRSRDQKIAAALRKQADEGSVYADPRQMNVNFGHHQPAMGFPKPKQQSEIPVNKSLTPDWLKSEPAPTHYTVDNLLFPIFGKAKKDDDEAKPALQVNHKTGKVTALHDKE